MVTRQLQHADFSRESRVRYFLNFLLSETKGLGRTRLCVIMINNEIQFGLVCGESDYCCTARKYAMASIPSQGRQYYIARLWLRST